MEPVESVLANVSLFERLRPDEIARVARRFVVETLAAGETRMMSAALDEARITVVVRGVVDVEVTTAAGKLSSRLDVGDRSGDVALLTRRPRPTTLTAVEAATLAMLDAAAMDAILAEFPAVALPLARELASELNAMNDVLRQLVEVHAEDLSPNQLASALDERRQHVAERGARVRRLSPAALFRRLVVQQGGEPPFWMLTGFILSLGLARLTVALILKYGLEKQLFALIPGHDPNPMHVHHFNYGLILIGASGLAALFPFGRRALRTLAFAFGFGCGLVFDEFALFWNLNPEYAQSLSLIAAAIMAALLMQLTYFRRYWSGLLRRTWYSVRGAR